MRAADKIIGHDGGLPDPQTPRTWHSDSASRHNLGPEEHNQGMTKHLLGSEKHNVGPNEHYIGPEKHYYRCILIPSHRSRAITTLSWSEATPCPYRCISIQPNTKRGHAYAEYSFPINCDYFYFTNGSDQPLEIR